MQPVSEDVSDRAAVLAHSMREGCIGVRVGRLHRLVTRRFEQALAPIGLSISQMEVLSTLLVVGEPVKPTDIAGWLAIERSTMSRNLALMQRRGLIESTDTSPTGRSQKVTITNLGIRTLADADRAWQQAQASVRDAVGPDASTILDTWLAKIT